MRDHLGQSYKTLCSARDEILGDSRNSETIVSDRDPRFMGRFWTEVFKLLGSELHFSTSFHPQTDGQTERVNALLEEYLRHFVSANQKDWVRLLDVALFCYNLQRSEASGHSPFERATPFVTSHHSKGLHGE